MINPLDVPMVYAVRRENSVKTVYDPRSSFVNTPTSPAAREDRGTALWGKFFRSMCRLPVSNGVDENTNPKPGYLLFPPALHPPAKLTYPLELIAADLNLNSNTILHHTDQYHTSNATNNAHLVVRRGQSFVLDLIFNREYNPSVDDLRLEFEIGFQPSISNLTKIVLRLDNEKRNVKGWWANLEQRDGNRLKIRVNTSSNSVVGSWNLKVATIVKKVSTNNISNLMDSQSLIRGLYILFNPWCSDDLVFMSDGDEREEYVLKDVGKIWRGSVHSPRPFFWAYGQFEEDVLSACFYVLDGSRLPMAQRSNPLQMARVIAQMANSVDDNGVLVGNWTNEFIGGTPPTDWTGSATILRHYMQSGQPVLFGQCWVFSGLVTTMLRCLGIPARVVTNYASAHDTGTTISVNTYFKSTGKIELDRTRDTKWNYHTWNECWMTRPDLPHGYGGWQAVDSTPQEKIDGFYRVGPASVRAIREGEIGFCHETSCVFAEVNADKCYWLCNDDGNDTLISVNNDEISQLIITEKCAKSVGQNDYLNITELYKFRTESATERNAVMDALLPGHTSEITAFTKEQENPSKADMEFALEIPKTAKVGDDFETMLKITNKSNEPRNVKIWLRVEAGCYHGGEMFKIKGMNGLTFTFQPNESRSANLPVLLQDYLGKTFNHYTFFISVLCKVKETDQVFAKVDDFCLIMPDVNIKINPDLKAGGIAKAVLEFNNPLPVLLSRCKFIVDGPGIVECTEVTCSDVQPRSVAKVELNITPYKSGKSKLIIAHFTSDKLQDADGFVFVNVKG